MTDVLPSRRGLVLRTLLSWDLLVAVVAAALFAVALLSSERDLEDLFRFVVVAIPFGVAIATYALTSLRWVTDRLKDSEYGRLVRSQDPDELAVSLPFYVVAGAGLLCSLLALVGATIVGEIDRTATVAVMTGLFLLSLYALLGTVSLFGIGARHQRNSAKMQRIREETQRELRDEARKRSAS